MRIGTMVYVDSMDGVKEKFAKLVEYGVDNFQLCSWKPSVWTKENADTILEYVKELNLTISAFWCGWEGPVVWDFYDGQITLGLVPPEYRALRVDTLCKGADFAKMLGVTDVVTHMGFIPENPYDPNFAGLCVAVRAVAEHLEKNGQYLLFETGQETPVTMLRCFEKVGTKNLGVNLDTANLILYGKANPVDALDVFGTYVRGVHAKDGCYPTNGTSLGVETRVGEGKVDFEAFFRKLKDLGYEGCITIEREIEGEEQIRDILDSKKYFETILAEI